MGVTQAKQFQQRTLEILSVLNKLTYASRAQLQVICGLGGSRNTSRILSRIESDGYVFSYQRTQKVYALSRAGRTLLGVDGTLPRGAGHVDHALLLNDAYLELNQPTDWRVEAPVTYKRFNKQHRIVPDAICTTEGRMTFVEADRTQAFKVTKEKLELYADLQDFMRAYQREKKDLSRPIPFVRYFCTNEYKADKIRGLMDECKAQGHVGVID